MGKAELFATISRLADTEGTKINAAETSRVCKLLLDELAKMTLKEVAELLKD